MCVDVRACFLWNSISYSCKHSTELECYSPAETCTGIKLNRNIPLLSSTSFSPSSHPPHSQILYISHCSRFQVCLTKVKSLGHLAIPLVLKEKHTLKKKNQITLNWSKIKKQLSSETHKPIVVLLKKKNPYLRPANKRKRLRWAKDLSRATRYWAVVGVA